MARISKSKTPFIPLTEEINGKTSLIRIIQNITHAIMAGTLLKRDGNQYTKASIKKYNRTIYWLRYYEENRGTIYLEDLDLELVENFILFMKQETLSKNSIPNIVTVVKKVLKKMDNQGRISFNSASIRIGDELKVALCNTEEELALMFNLDLSQNHPLQLVRDAYIIQCNTGLRFSYLKKVLANIKNYITEENNNLYLQIPEKNITIPLPSIVKDILERNNYNFKQTLDYTSYNSAIKIIAEMAGINTQITISHTQGARRVNISRAKSTLLSTHTACTTFAVYGFLAQIPVPTIIKILGHSTPQSLFNISSQKEIKPLQKSFKLPYAKQRVNAAA